MLRALTTIPFVLPTVVVAVAFAALLGPNGVLNQWAQAWFGFDTPPIHLQQTIWAILIAHVFYNVSIIIRSVGGFWANLNPRLEEAAAVLGAGTWQRLRHVTLPLLLPSILASSLLIFLFCFTSFGVILILGGLRFATLEVEIYRQAGALFNLPAAAILSLIQMLCTFGVMAVYTRLHAPRQFAPGTAPADLDCPPPRTWADKNGIGHRLCLYCDCAAFALASPGMAQHYSWRRRHHLGLLCRAKCQPPPKRLLCITRRRYPQLLALCRGNRRLEPGAWHH